MRKLLTPKVGEKREIPSGTFAWLDRDCSIYLMKCIIHRPSSRAVYPAHRPPVS
jgi:hypothetical protein